MSAADDDEPMTLEEACRIIFKDNIKPDSLRAEAGRGRLEIERIGRRDFVTRAGIREMRKLCRLVPPQKAHASGSKRNDTVPMDRSSGPSGASGTMEDTNVALAALLMTVETLSGNSPDTLRNGTRRRGAKVIQLKPARSTS